MSGWINDINHELGSWLGFTAKEPGHPSTPPPVPTESNTAAAADAAAAEEMRKRRLGGKSSTYLTEGGASGLSDTGTVSSSSLMGG